MITPTEKHLEEEAAFARFIARTYSTSEDFERDMNTLITAGYTKSNKNGECLVYGPPPSKRLQQVVIRVVRVNPKRGVMRAIIPGFNPRLTISIPLRLIPPEIAMNLESGKRLYGYVNIGAESWRDLVFVDFEED